MASIQIGLAEVVRPERRYSDDFSSSSPLPIVKRRNMSEDWSSSTKNLVKQMTFLKKKDCSCEGNDKKCGFSESEKAVDHQVKKFVVSPSDFSNPSDWEDVTKRILDSEKSIGWREKISEKSIPDTMLCYKCNDEQRLSYVPEFNEDGQMEKFGVEIRNFEMCCGHAHGSRVEEWMLFASMGIIIGFAFVGVFLAKYMRKKVHDTTLEFFNCAAAGIFLAMCFFHVFPEALLDIVELAFSEHAKVEQGTAVYYQHKKNEMHEFIEPYFQQAGALLFAGYVLILFFERFVSNLFVSKTNKEMSCSIEDCTDDAVLDEECPDNRQECPDNRQECPDKRQEYPDNRQECPDKRQECADKRCLDSECTSLLCQVQDDLQDNCHKHDEVDSDTSDSRQKSCHGRDECGHDHGIPAGTSTISAIFLLLALGVHGFTEGMVVGSLYESTEQGKPLVNLLLFVTCICLHIWCEAFILAGSILQAKFSASMFWVMVVMHACVNPLGCMCHIAFRHYVGDNDQMAKISPFLNAFACGCLTYISVSEIVPEVFHGTGRVRSGMKWVTFVGAGSILMIVIKIFHHH